MAAREVGKVNHTLDWKCRYCGSYHPPENYSCKQCGAPRTNPIKFTGATKEHVPSVTLTVCDGVKILLHSYKIEIPPVEYIECDASNNAVVRFPGLQRPPEIHGTTSMEEWAYLSEWISDLSSSISNLSGSPSSHKRDAALTFGRSSDIGAESSEIRGLFLRGVYLTELQHDISECLVTFVVDAYSLVKRSK